MYMNSSLLYWSKARVTKLDKSNPGILFHKIFAKYIFNFNLFFYLKKFYFNFVIRKSPNSFKDISIIF